MGFLCIVAGGGAAGGGQWALGLDQWWQPVLRLTGSPSGLHLQHAELSVLSKLPR